MRGNEIQTVTIDEIGVKFEAELLRRLDALKGSGVRVGEIHVISSGRQSGKSRLSRLTDEFARLAAIEHQVADPKALGENKPTNAPHGPARTRKGKQRRW